MNQQPNKWKYRWQDLTLEKLLSPWQLFWPHPSRSSLIQQVEATHAGNFQATAIFCKTTRKFKKKMIFDAKCFKKCFLWLVCCCFDVIFKNCSTTKHLVRYLICLPHCPWQKDVQSLLCKLDTCRQTIPKHF